MLPNTFDFNNDMWRLRALFVPNAPFSGEDPSDVYIWFLAHHDQDLWLALALSDEATAHKAETLMDHIDGGLQDALLTFVGEPWEIINVMPVPHAQAMRDIISTLNATQLDQLRRMSHEEIEAIRNSESKFDAWLDSVN